MTKHDTVVRIKPNSPYESALQAFEDGFIPMRDPFPMERGVSDTGEVTSLWVTDWERMSDEQIQALAVVIANHCGATPEEVLEDARPSNGFGIREGWIESMQCGAEGFQRCKEVADFLENTPQPPTAEAYKAFYDDQYRRWIDGNEQPPPMPKTIEGFDPRLVTPELEEALKNEQIAKALEGYSVFDVLTGQAMVEILNNIDPDYNYSIATDEDDEG